MAEICMTSMLRNPSNEMLDHIKNNYKCMFGKYILRDESQNLQFRTYNLSNSEMQICAIIADKNYEKVITLIEKSREKCVELSH